MYLYINMRLDAVHFFRMAVYILNGTVNCRTSRRLLLLCDFEGEKKYWGKKMNCSLLPLKNRLSNKWTVKKQS